MDTTTIEVSEATKRLPELITRVVEKNETFIISDNGKPTVVLIDLATLKNFSPPLPGEERRIVREKSDVNITNKNFSELTNAIDTSVEEIKAAFSHFEKFGLVSVNDNGEVYVSPLAMKRATSDVQRRLASYLSGYELTENSYIVRNEKTLGGVPVILNNRMPVGIIAQYFAEGWSLPAIEKEFPFLYRDEIVAAIHYYLNHRDEIDEEIRRIDEEYRKRASEQELKWD